jgi:hypothetical protein
MNFIYARSDLLILSQSKKENKMNDQEFTPKTRTTMAVITLVFGLFGVFIVPIVVQNTFNTLTETLIRLMVEDPHFKMAPTMLTIWFVGMLGITVVASVTLIVNAYPLRKGKPWAWPLALSCLSLPTIFAVIEILPYVVHIGKPPPTIFILIIGLITYWAILMLKKGDRSNKISHFFTFTLLGVVAGHINVLTMHGFKGILDRPESPLFTDLDHAIYGVEAPMNFMAMIMCIVAIPLLASRNRAGWWLGLIAGSCVIVANLPTHLIRMNTSDFIVATMLGLGLVISLLFPGCKENLLGEPGKPG